MRALLIEDDTTIAQVVTRGLDEAGYAVVHASDGIEGLDAALDAALDGGFDVVAGRGAERDGDDDDGDEEIEWDVARVYLELNDTDGDLGFHALFDGEPWDRATIESPSERILFRVAPRGALAAQGLSEVFSESDEPAWDPVLYPHPTLGRAGDIELVAYQVVVEREEPTRMQLSLDVEPVRTSLTIPDALVGPGDELKVEVLAIATNGNQVATESCFVSAD